MPFLKPMLCGLKTAENLVTPDMIWEKKEDGERLEAEIMLGGKKFFYARSGREKARMYPDLQIDVKVDCILDGEVVARTGKFNDIQHRANRENGIAEAAKQFPVKYRVFDILRMGSNDLSTLTLTQRKTLLNQILIPNPTCEIVETYTDGPTLWGLAQSYGWEGLVGKKVNSRYGYGARGEDWIKIKVLKRGTFYVVGFTPGTGWRTDSFGAMILADLKSVDNQLPSFVPVGEVGTGFDNQEIERLNAKMRSTILPAGSPAYFPYPTPPTGPVTWVQPFKVEIEYLEMTNSGKIRFPSYKGEVA